MPESSTPWVDKSDNNDVAREACRRPRYKVEHEVAGFGVHGTRSSLSDHNGVVIFWRGNMLVRINVITRNGAELDMIWWAHRRYEGINPDEAAAEYKEKGYGRGWKRSKTLVCLWSLRSTIAPRSENPRWVASCVMYTLWRGDDQTNRSHLFHTGIFVEYFPSGSKAPTIPTVEVCGGMRVYPSVRLFLTWPPRHSQDRSRFPARLSPVGSRSPPFGICSRDSPR